MRRDDFKLGENVELSTYNYDDQGNEYKRRIKGIVIQITNSFIVIDNGHYKESFKYSEFTKCTPGNIENQPYDASLENYSQDIITQCIKNIMSNKEGIVFNNEQLEQVFSSINKKDYKVKEIDGIFYINKN